MCYISYHFSDLVTMLLGGDGLEMESAREQLQSKKQRVKDIANEFKRNSERSSQI